MKFNPDNPEATVIAYRAWIALRDVATSKAERERREAKAQKLRKAWAAWQGEDCLHEMAFGEPVE